MHVLVEIKMVSQRQNVDPSDITDVHDFVWLHRTIYIEVDYFAFKFTEHPSATQ